MNPDSWRRNLKPDEDENITMKPFICCKTFIQDHACERFDPSSGLKAEEEPATSAGLADGDADQRQECSSEWIDGTTHV